MTHCERALALFFAPLVLGALIGVAIANTWLTALEDAQRERRQRDASRVTRRDTALDTELRLFIWEAANMGGLVVEYVNDGGESVWVN
jgi:hypothetical protein